MGRARDVGHDALGLRETAARHQPARTFGQIAPYEQNRNRQYGAERERDPPTHIGAETTGLEQNDTQSGAPRGADPKAAVDRKVDEAAYARRDQLVDCGVDRCVLAADAESGEKPAKHERLEVERRGREQRAD